MPQYSSITPARERIVALALMTGVSVFLVIDQTNPAPGSVGRIISQHKTVRAAREAARYIRHYLRRTQGGAAATGIALYRAEGVFRVGTMAPAQSTWPVDPSELQL